MLRMRPAVDVFSEWVDAGKDTGMEIGHSPAVNEILSAAFKRWIRVFSNVDLRQ